MGAPVLLICEFEDRGNRNCFTIYIESRKINISFSSDPNTNPSKKRFDPIVISLLEKVILIIFLKDIYQY